MNAQLNFALATLTVAQAKAYAADPDKWLHVEYNYLDVWGFKATERNVTLVENRFDELLAPKKP